MPSASPSFARSTKSRVRSSGRWARSRCSATITSSCGAAGSCQPRPVAQDVATFKLAVAAVRLDATWPKTEEPPVGPFRGGVPTDCRREVRRQAGSGIGDGYAVQDFDVDHDRVVGRPDAESPQPDLVEVPGGSTAVRGGDHDQDS